MALALRSGARWRGHAGFFRGEAMHCTALRVGVGVGVEGELAAVFFLLRVSRARLRGEGEGDGGGLAGRLALQPAVNGLSTPAFAELFWFLDDRALSVVVPEDEKHNAAEGRP